MKKIVLLAFTIALLTSCSMTESEENSKPTMYRYGTVVKIKEGFFKGYGCALIREYSDSVFCKIVIAPDGTRINEFWETNQNFKKSNIQIIENSEE